MNLKWAVKEQITYYKKVLRKQEYKNLPKIYKEKSLFLIKSGQHCQTNWRQNRNESEEYSHTALDEGNCSVVAVYWNFSASFL